MSSRTVTLTPAQARDLNRDQHLAPEAGTVDLEARTFTPGPDAVALLLARAAQLNPGYAQPFLKVAAKVQAAN